VERLVDDDFIKVEYLAGRGNHQLTGATVFQQRLPGVRMIRSGEGWKIDYGRQSGGRRLLVHVSDFKMMPGKFMPIQEDIAATAPPPPREPPPEPEPLVSPPPMERPAPVADEPLAPPVPLEDEAEQPLDFQRIPGVGPALAAQFAERGIATKLDVLKLGAGGLRQFDGVGEKKAALIIKALEDAD